MNVVGVVLLVNERPIKFIIDSGSPVSLIPQHRFNNTTPIQPLKQKYGDVNDNRIEFFGKTIANIKADDGDKFNLELLKTNNQTNPLHGLDWMHKLGVKINTKPGTEIQLVKKDERR